MELDLAKLSCNVCRASATVCPTASEGARPSTGSYRPCQVRAFSANQALARFDMRKHHHLHDETLLTVLPSDLTTAADHKRSSRGEMSALKKTGYLGIVGGSGEANDFGVRVLNQKVFDIRLATDQMAYYQQNHGKSCKSARDQIPNMRVIDCVTRDIICAPAACQYVALSYVCGTSTRTC